MKKTTIILLAILLIGTLTGFKLYNKYQKTELKAKQAELDRKNGEKILQKEKEAKIAKMKEIESRRNDSIATITTKKMNEGLQMLKEARENLK